MKKAIVLILLIFGFIKADSDTNKFGILTNGMGYIENKDAKIAIKVWINELTSENLDKEITLEYFDEKEDVYEKFLSGDVEYLGLSTLHYLKDKHKLDPNIRDWYVFLTSQEEYIRYFLVTKNSAKIKSIKDLKNSTLGIQKSENLELLYLDHTLLEKKLPTHEKYLSEIQTYNKHSRVLMKLFFNKIDACIVPEHIWNMMTEMNPQIAKKLKVLDRSEKIFMPNLSLISKDMSDKLYRAHQDNSIRLQNSSKGEQILTLLKAKVYKSVDKTYFDPMYDYYQEYLALKKR